MKKIVLAIAIAVSTCNLAIGISYAAVCQDTHGNRFCGGLCATEAGGICGCGGPCSDAEMKWVGGNKGAEELEEVYDY
jgi:hypothetical protein